MDVNTNGLPAQNGSPGGGQRRLLDDEFVTNAISRSAENPSDRRRFLRRAGLAGLGAVATGAMLTARPGIASAATTESSADDAVAITDSAILNFALNLEYLEANFYSYAVHGSPISTTLTGGTGTQGGVSGGKQVPFKTAGIQQLAQQIAGDELSHVTFLRSALGSAAVSQPSIDLVKSFTAAAQAAGVVPAGTAFDPFSSENFFLLGAFIFEDVGVTAYKGAAPLISSKTYLGAAAGIRLRPCPVLPWRRAAPGHPACTAAAGPAGTGGPAGRRESGRCGHRGKTKYRRCCCTGALRGPGRSGPVAAVAACGSASAPLRRPPCTR
jgi:hypothetical protein